MGKTFFHDFIFPSSYCLPIFASSSHANIFKSCSCSQSPLSLCSLSPFLMGFGPQYSWNYSCQGRIVTSTEPMQGPLFCSLLPWPFSALPGPLPWSLLLRGCSDGKMAPSLVFSYLTDSSFSVSFAGTSPPRFPLLVSLRLSPGPFSLFYSPPKWSTSPWFSSLVCQ